ncbi:MAG TPA: PadR family transcriptional regulator [Longimicrobiales bacterium]|jgi:DNA-binding PadR family transcriptional regulator
MGRTLGLVTAAVLQAVRDGRRYGADIIDATELGGGTVYKTLSRMEDRGLVRGRWEDADVAEAEKRPRRRYYELTAAGRDRLDDALERFRALAGTGMDAAHGTRGPEAQGAGGGSR